MTLHDQRIDGAECPFCPSNGLVIEGTKRKGYHVTCCSCLAQGPTVSSPDEAEASWNKRFTPRVPS